MNHLSVRCLSVWLHLSGVTRLHLLLMTGCVTEANRRAPVGKQTAPARTAVFTRGWINVHAKIKNVFANTGVKVGAFWSVCDGTERIHSRSHSQRLDYRQLSHRPLATQSTLYWGISHDNKKREMWSPARRIDVLSPPLVHQAETVEFNTWGAWPNDVQCKFQSWVG